MFLNRLKLQNFKNYATTELLFKGKVICLTGENGAGKTNLLDSIYYLCLTKSYFNSIDFQNINYDADFFRIEGDFMVEDIKTSVSCVVQKGKRKLMSKNGVPYQKMSEHVGEFPIVIITPDDNILITGGGDERRRFMDNILSQLSHEYLDHLMAYNRALMQRNTTLKKFSDSKSFDATLINAYDKKLIGHGQQIYEARKSMLKDFIPYFQEYYKVVSGQKEVVGIRYNSDLDEKPYSEQLNKNLEKDLLLQRTTAGVHKDDLEFTMNNHAVKKFGSQGQQKSYLIALKLAQYEFLKIAKQASPILLLDDVFDKLDMQRAQNVLNFLSGQGFGQIFITDTSFERISDIFKENMHNVEIFKVRNGEIV